MGVLQLQGLPAASFAASGVTRKLYYNVRDYGAVGDGVADDTTALQAAMTAASGSATAGGVVFLPPGKYLTSSTLTLPGAVSLLGCGWGASWIVPTDTAHDVLAVNIGGGSKTFHHMLAGFAIYAKTNFTAGAAIHLGNSGKGTVRDIKIDASLGGKPYYGVQLDTVSDTCFNNVRVEGAVADAWYLATPDATTIVEIFWDAACTARNAGGWGFNVAPGNTVSGNGDIEGLHWEATSIYGNTSGGITLNAGTAQAGKTIRNVHLNGTYLDTNSGPGLQTAGTAIIENLALHGVWASANHGYGLYLGSNLRMFLVSSGMVMLNNTDGVRVDGPQNGTIANLLMKSNSQTTDLASYGLYVTGSPQEVVFANLHIYNDAGGYTNRQNGIYVDTSVLDLDFFDVKCDTGSGTTKLSHHAASSQRVRYSTVRDNTGGNLVTQVHSGSSGSDVGNIDLFGNASFTGSLKTSNAFKSGQAAITSGGNTANQFLHTFSLAILNAGASTTVVLNNTLATAITVLGGQPIAEADPGSGVALQWWISARSAGTSITLGVRNTGGSNSVATDFTAMLVN